MQKYNSKLNLRVVYKLRPRSSHVDRMNIHIASLLPLLYLVLCNATPALIPTLNPLFPTQSLAESKELIIFPVPNTITLLKISFGPPIDPHALATLLAVSSSAINNAAALFGEYASLPGGPFLEVKDRYAFSVGRTYGARMTWKLAKDTISGLRRFYIERKVWKCVAVQIWEGSDATDGKRLRVGDAIIRRAPGDGEDS